MSLMTLVFVFVLSTLRQRLNKPTLWQRYGPLCLVTLAIPLIVADLWRHILQDRTLTVLDLLAMFTLWAAIASFIFARMAFTKQPWGPFSVPRGSYFVSFYFQQVPMCLVLLASLFIITGHTTSNWFGATRLDWPECGDNPTFNRVNKTWTSACTWSSSQYRCENVCCVPGGDGSQGIVDISHLPGGDCHCSCIADDKENLWHLSPIGILFTLFFTYLGFILLAIGTLWNASIVDKLKEIRSQWDRLRGSASDDDGPRLQPGSYDPHHRINVELDGEHDADMYDMVVIGGGSGGLACAKACANLGKKVAVVDYVTPSPPGTTWGLGGTCVNVGCIPKKLMHEAGLRGERREADPSYGWPEAHGPHDWLSLCKGVQNYIHQLNNNYEEELEERNITYFNALAVFVGPNELELRKAGQSTSRIFGRYFVLAMGGRPTYPDIEGAVEYGITSDDLFSLPKDPGSVVVVGGSYVALECAGFLAELGHQVTVFMRSIPLRGFDQQMAELVVNDMVSRGVQFQRPGVPLKVTCAPNGQRQVWYKPPVEEGDEAEEEQEQCCTCDTVIFAIGRKPCTTGLGLDIAGVQLAKSGKVIADKWGSTSASHIFAIGDIVEGGLELTPVAIRAGQCLANYLFNEGTAAVDYQNVPTTVFTPLEYGCVGLPEEEALEKYGEDNVEVYHSELTPLEWALGRHDDQKCYVKLICNAADDMKVVGFHILCPGAGEITQGVAVAMQAGARKSHFDAAIGIHPTLAEIITTLTITKRSAASAVKQGC